MILEDSSSITFHYVKVVQEVLIYSLLIILCSPHFGIKLTKYHRLKVFIEG